MFIVYLRLSEHFHQRCLRTILNIHRRSYVSNVEVHDQAEITSIEAMLLKSQLRWVGPEWGKASHAQDSPVWWTLNWLPWQRGTKETFQRLPQEDARYLPHWPPSVVDTCCWPSGLAPHRQPGLFHFWGLLQSQPQGETPPEEDPGSHTIPHQTFNCSRCGRTCLSCIGFVCHQHACSRREQPLL